MTEKRILVVDDDPKVRTLLRRALEGQGYHVIEAADGDTVRKVFADAPPDIVTLDLTLGAEDGFDIARDIRRQHDVPIIMVTGKDDVIDRVVGLELGADDYLTKPFHVREVLARVRSVLRRYGGQVPGPAMQTAETDADRQTMRLDGLHIDHDRMEVTRRDGTACDLTSGEFRLLAAFIAHPRRPLSRDRLMTLIDGPDWSPLDRTIDNQVARLRKKIERDPANPALIKTVRGVGYILTESAVPQDYSSANTA